MFCTKHSTLSSKCAKHFPCFFHSPNSAAAVNSTSVDELSAVSAESCITSTTPAKNVPKHIEPQWTSY